MIKGGEIEIRRVGWAMNASCNSYQNEQELERAHPRVFLNRLPLILVQK
jgi:hypothetical protein